MGAPPPLVGYNTNVRHKGKLFHIQTEDSGITKPHVITHLFADGGRIVATRKTNYAEHVAVPDREDVVRRIMKDQHKAMFVALRDGVYDESDAARVAAAAAANATAAASVRPDGGFSPTPHSGIVAGFDPNAAAEGSATPVDPSVVPSPPGATPATAMPAAVAPRATPAVSTVPPVPAAPRAVPAPVRPSQSPSAAIAAARARRSAPPPPPSRTAVTPPARPAAGGTRPPSRPAPQARPVTAPAPKSIFGQDLISEKSLDEVILSYLSRDLDEK